MLNVNDAERELGFGAELTNGLWVAHSRATAVNARLIAEKCGMDGDRAYIFGLLHDIGRRNGSWGIAHIFDGYEYMTGIGEAEIARICLTHSFPIKDERTYIGKIDCSDGQKVFLSEFLTAVDYDDYDLLIQLCDSISLPSGACIMEKRLVDVALRHGLRDFTLDKWRAFMRIKKYFDGKCGCNIYELLPNIAENSFADLI